MLFGSEIAASTVGEDLVLVMVLSLFLSVDVVDEVFKLYCHVVVVKGSG